MTKTERARVESWPDFMPIRYNEDGSPMLDVFTVPADHPLAKLKPGDRVTEELGEEHGMILMRGRVAMVETDTIIIERRKVVTIHYVLEDTGVDASEPPF